MSNGLSVQDRKVDGSTVIAGVIANAPISKPTQVSELACRALRVDIEVSAITVVGSITAKLQHKSPNGAAWVDMTGANATLALTTTGTATITQLVERAADQANMPIRQQIRVVVSNTNAGDTVTVDNVWVYGIPG